MAPKFPSYYVNNEHLPHLVSVTNRRPTFHLRDNERTFSINVTLGDGSSFPILVNAEGKKHAKAIVRRFLRSIGFTWVKFPPLSQIREVPP